MQHTTQNTTDKKPSGFTHFEHLNKDLVARYLAFPCLVKTAEYLLENTVPQEAKPAYDRLLNLLRGIDIMVMSYLSIAKHEDPNKPVCGFVRFHDGLGDGAYQIHLMFDEAIFKRMSEVMSTDVKLFSGMALDIRAELNNSVYVDVHPGGIIVVLRDTYRYDDLMKLSKLPAIAIH